MTPRQPSTQAVTAATRGRKDAEFTEKIKQTIAAEAGYACANPSCCAPTHAPGSTAQEVGMVGQAAHISAAAAGFARWLPNMDPEVRKSAANGIWLCNTHAREIDVDEHRHSIALLHAWKRRAKARALAARGHPPMWAPAGRTELIRASRTLRMPVADSAIGELVEGFMADVGGIGFWNPEKLECLSLALYEIALNAVRHGRATFLHVRSRGYRIDLVHDGSDFNPATLTGATGNGGTASLNYLAELFGNDMSIRYKYNGEVATIQLIDASIAGPDHPCAVPVVPDWAQTYSGTLESCTVVHLFPQRSIKFSDAPQLDLSTANADDDVIYVLHDTNRRVIEHLRRTFPMLRAPGEAL